jgi:hypothetical protein
MTPSNAPEDGILCPCFDFSIMDLQAMVAADPAMSYEEFTKKSGVGGKCTACTLDLEHYFVGLPRTRPSGQSERAWIRERERMPLKQRLYRFIDNLTPGVAIDLYEHLPVLVGQDIEQALIIANYSLLYEGEQRAPDIQLDLTLRDCEGDVVWASRPVLGSDQSLREPLTERLNEAAVNASKEPARGGIEGLGVGSLQVIRRARSSGVRGTTRPQTEIVARKGACAIHGQSAGLTRGADFTCLWRPEDQRILISFVNASDRPLALGLRYPVGALDVAAPGRPTARLDVPPHGARLHEIKLSSEDANAVGDGPFKICWAGAGQYKAHIFVSTPDLDRFSIDHV